jgi:NADH:ubiquinone oxidoreductase subunit K
LHSSLRHKLPVLLLCVSLLLFAEPAKAQIGGISGPIGISKSQATWIIVGIVAAGAAIGIGIYLVIHHNHDRSITGCAVSSGGSLSLQHEGDQRSYNLLGDTAAIKPGDRVRVSGKERKEYPSGNHDFLVDKLAKDYGPCKALPATP